MRPLPRYILAIMAAFVAFELWIPLLAFVVRALVGPTVPTAVQAVAALFGLAVPTLVGLALSDYLADRPGLVRPYQPKRRASDLGEEEPQEDQDDLEEDDEQWDETERDEQPVRGEEKPRAEQAVPGGEARTPQQGKDLREEQKDRSDGQ